MLAVDLFYALDADSRTSELRHPEFMPPAISRMIVIPNLIREL